MQEFLQLIFGLAGLWLGSEILIRGAIALADRFNVADALIGMFILAIGTDLPELFITFDASWRSLTGEDMSEIIVGSVVGSGIGQLGLVMGVAGFIGFGPRPLKLALRNSVFLLGALILLALFSLDGLISRSAGWILIATYTAYLVSLAVWPTPHNQPKVDTDAGTKPLLKDIFFIATGLVLLLFAAELTVVSATAFAALVGLSNLGVSAVIIGLGSSLPELSVSVVALLKNRGGLSIGNLMGSNVLDTLLVPGIGAAISPLAVPVSVLWLDLPVLALITLLVLGFLYVSPRGVQKIEGCILLVIYTSYILVRGLS